MKKSVRHASIICALAGVLAACGNGTTSPSSAGSSSGGGNSGGGGTSGGNATNCSVPVGVLGCPKGLIRATLDGQTFNGGVATGGSIYTPIAPNPGLNLPAQDFFTLVGIATNNSQLSITARAKTGTASLGQNVIDSETRNVSINSAQLVFPATGGSAIGAGWLTSVAGGSGTITVDAVSQTAASGSFSFQMAPTAGTPATGNRQISGTFNVTF